VRISPHHATHAAAAETFSLAPAGRFGELIEVTDRVTDVVREERGRLCQMGSVGLAGRALALFERGDPAAAMEALELFDAAPPPGGVVRLQCVAIDLLRPLAGLPRTRRAMAQADRAGTTLAGRVYELRLSLQRGGRVARDSRRTGPGATRRAVHRGAAARRPAALPGRRSARRPLRARRSKPRRDGRERECEGGRRRG